MNNNLRCIEHRTDFCVVGGGLSGICAAVEAARHGAKVILMHDRPVLGGNASSEIRMWISGAHGENNRETGILEELSLETFRRNPYRLYPIWDSILFELIRKEKNIKLLLNCSCNDALTEDGKIVKVMGWQGTTQTWHTVYAAYFADCSGDSILAPLTGAEYRSGREARSEFGESIAPVNSDKFTMGNSCLIQARQMSEKRTFTPPDNIRKFTKKDLVHREPNMDDMYENYWYMELGGTKDTIHDAEEIRDDLVDVAFGIWDYIKNSGDCRADDWDLDFVGFLPGKRESRRYVGDYIMTENDVLAKGQFDDTVAYGGWTMDDHNPKGIDTTEPPNIFHKAPSPFGIPYRCLYSKNISNLFFAGRNISVTHSAMSATRVMGTCALLGQAVGAAASIALQHATSPRGVYENHISLLKQRLMEDDCYLPLNKFEHSEITKNAIIYGDGECHELLINGIERPVGNCDNMWKGKVGDSIYFDLGKVTSVKEIRFVFDSDLNRNTVSPDGFVKDRIHICNRPLDCKPVNIPKTLISDLEIEAFVNGKWTHAGSIEDNYMRLVKVKVDTTASKLRFTVKKTCGNETVGIHSIDVR